MVSFSFRDCNISVGSFGWASLLFANALFWWVVDGSSF